MGSDGKLRQQQDQQCWPAGKYELTVGSVYRGARSACCLLTSCTAYIMRAQPPSLIETCIQLRAEAKARFLDTIINAIQLTKRRPKRRPFNCTLLLLSSSSASSPSSQVRSAKGLLTLNDLERPFLYAITLLLKPAMCQIFEGGW